jgi:hypothetical protein
VTDVDIATARATTLQLRQLIERPEKCTFWGQPYTVTPRLIARVFGDGLRLICITPMAHRPNYFVVRVDSAMTHVNHPRPGQEVSLLEDIMCAAEEEYGTFGDEEERDEDGYESRPFPVTDWGIGCGWSKPFPIAEWKPTPSQTIGIGRQRTRARRERQGRR